MSKKIFIGSLILVGLILFCAFQSSFLDGMKLLGEIINVFGAVFVCLLKLIFSIQFVAEKIIKRIITTILVWGVCAWCCIDSDEEIKIVNIVINVIVAILFTVLSWIGMF